MNIKELIRRVKGSFGFADNGDLVVRWSGVALPELGRELEELLAKYGLEFAESYYNVEKHEKTLTFCPSSTAETGHV